MTIAVIGAKGHIGRVVVADLKARTAPGAVVALAGSPGGLARLLAATIADALKMAGLGAA